VLSEFHPQPSRKRPGMNISLPSAPEAICCRNCRFWRTRRTVDDAEDWGECRRMPPSLPEIGDEKLVVAGVWPCTKASDWCGEWETHNAELAPQHSP
jgi:hypothetical protein